MAHALPARRVRELLCRAITLGALACAIASAGLFAPHDAHAAAPAAFTLPPTSTLRASPHLVFAHYFTPYPISIDNKAEASDYYTNNYLSITGESGKHVAYGGLLRDRPLGRAPLPAASFALDDMKTEVQRASDAGLDGFTVDVLNIVGTNWDRVKLLTQAAATVDPGFKILLMPDMTSMTSVTDADLAAKMAELAVSPSVMRLGDGRLVLAPFAPEKRTVAWWTGFENIMHDQYGLTVALVPCFVNPSQQASFAPISYGLSNWGSRTMGQATSLANQAATVHGLGKLWMQPVSAQDSRPNQGYFTEAAGTQTLRETFEAAIAGADWVQIPTWNDYSENSHISPSKYAGRTWLDLTSWYLTKWKTGTAPTVDRDVLYLTHRAQMWATAPSFAETKLMTLMPGSKPAVDVAEVTAMLTAPGTLELTSGGMTTSQAVSAGLQTLQMPLGNGAVSARLVRSGVQVASVQSPWGVDAAPVRQEELYRSTDSLLSPGPSTDTTAPTAAFTAPTEAATVSGNVTVTATATDDVAVASVRLDVDGAPVNVDSVSPWTMVWNSTGASVGSHLLTLVVTDTSGNTVTVARSVQVRDTTAPTVSFTAPAAGAAVNGSAVGVTASGTDDVGVASVRLEVDGVAMGTDTATPYIFTWNADAAAAGAHQLTLIALDAAGNSSTAARTVAVRDTSAPIVAFTSPAASTSVTGTVSVGATASDDVAVAQVLLQVDGVDVATDPAAPWSFSWNTSTLWLGVHTLRIVASDGTGNSS
ncbi:MAG: hypothetical protein H7287_01630, partial [Thermoleophilia bacterium]|nr:hypothetical protein [Thermoleophilia bacterium]